MIAEAVRGYEYSKAKMVKSTQIARIDGLLLAATVDDEQAEAELADPKANAKMIIRRLNRNSEPQASIEAGKYTLQYVLLGPLSPLRRS